MNISNMVALVRYEATIGCRRRRLASAHRRHDSVARRQSTWRIDRRADSDDEQLQHDSFGALRGKVQGQADTGQPCTLDE